MKMIKVEDFNLSADYDNGHVSNELVIALRIDDETAAELKNVCRDTKPLLRDTDVASDSMQCGTPQHSLCGTCRNRFDCRLPDAYGGCFGYERQSNPLAEIFAEARSLNPIKEENKMEVWEQVEKAQAEIANAWKNRLKEEYAQLKERYEKLRAYNNKKEVEANLIGDRILKQEDYYSNRLLARQQEIMADYLKVLELRAELAHIKL